MKVTSLLTLLSCILCTLHTYIGNNIDCITGFKEKQDQKAVETYCFIASTYSVVNLTVGSPHYGIGPHNSASDDTDVKVHAYYQWVPFILAFQAALYYFPKWFWRSICDDNKIFKSLLGNLGSLQVIEKESEPEVMEPEDKRLHLQPRLKEPKHVEGSADYMARSNKRHNLFALKFLLCEFIAVVISLGNLFFTDEFLGGSFMDYGKSAFNYMKTDVTDMNNPLNQVFPKVTKCNWYMFGPSGSIQMYDALCVLPLNIVNEKTFIVLWFAFIITLAVVSLAFVFHIVLLFIPGLRHYLVLGRIHGANEKELYREIQHKLNYGDWFLLNHMSKRMMDSYFISWLRMVNKKLLRSE